MTPHLCLGAAVDDCEACQDLEPRCPAPYFCKGRGRVETVSVARNTYRCRRCGLEFWIEPGGVDG